METLAVLLGGWVGCFMGMWIAARVSDDKNLFLTLAGVPLAIGGYLIFLPQLQNNTSPDTVLVSLMTAIVAGVVGYSIQDWRDKRTYG